MKIRTTGGLRFKRCPDCDDLHDVHEWPDNHRRPGEALCVPMVIQDRMDAPIQSMATGEWFDSKAALRRTYKSSGNRQGETYTEVGGDPAILKPFKKPKPDRMKIKAAVHSAFSKVGLGA